METLIAPNWHRDAEGVRSQELANWTDTPFLLILICTGSIIKQDKIDQWLEKNSHRISENHFFCVLDRTVAGEVWGASFGTLEATIKERKHKLKRRIPRDGRRAGQKVGEESDETSGSESRPSPRSKKKARRNT